MSIGGEPCAGIENQPSWPDFGISVCELTVKYAFHFDPAHKDIGSPWHIKPQKKIYGALLRNPSWSSSTGVSLGDIVPSDLLAGINSSNASPKKQTELFYLRAGEWLGSAPRADIDVDRLLDVLRQRVFTICIEAITNSAANRIHRELSDAPYYLGYIEVDEEIPIHFALYRRLLRPGRIVGHEFHVFANSLDPACEETDEWRLSEFRELGVFAKVSFEPSGGRFTIFDREDDFNHIRKIAQARRLATEYLGAVADEVITIYRDAVPGFGDAVWALFDTLARAETEDQFSHIALSCRRLIDRVADSLYPPSSSDERLGAGKSRNRLRAFVTSRVPSGTNRELVLAEIASLFDRLSTLAELTNKGIHADLQRAEARRLVVRTILFLDDVASLAGSVLPMAVAPISSEDFRKMVLGELAEGWEE